MRIVVLGAGALGSLVGGLLARDHDVTLVGREPHAAAVRANGLQITGRTDRTVEVRATTTTANLEPPDLVLLTTKAHATGGALAGAAELFGPHTHVLSLQNGLGNVELVAARVGPARTIGGSTSHGAFFVAPGHVEHSGIGDTTIGPLAPPASAIHHVVAEALTRTGLETHVVDDIMPELWAKVAVNAAINPLTAITGLPNGGLLGVPELAALVADVASEVEDVARARGLDVSPGAYVARAKLVAERTAKNRSSMLQDVERGRRTEIDAICGAIVKAASDVGLEAPRNRALRALVKGIEATLRYDG